MLYTGHPWTSLTSSYPIIPWLNEVTRHIVRVSLLNPFHVLIMNAMIAELIVFLALFHVLFISQIITCLCKINFIFFYVIPYESPFKTELESYTATALMSIPAFLSIIEGTVETSSGMAGKKAHICHLHLPNIIWWYPVQNVFHMWYLWNTLENDLWWFGTTYSWVGFEPPLRLKQTHDTNNVVNFAIVKIIVSNQNEVNLADIIESQ
jgi:hypothetical protein